MRIQNFSIYSRLCVIQNIKTRQTKRTAVITTSSDGKTVQQTYEEEVFKKYDPLAQYDPWVEQTEGALVSADRRYDRLSHRLSVLTLNAMMLLVKYILQKRSHMKLCQQHVVTSLIIAYLTRLVISTFR